MFGFFKAKKTTTDDLVRTVLQTAIVCRAEEMDNADDMTEPTQIWTRVNELAASGGKTFSAAETEICGTWVMAFLLDGAFVESLVGQAQHGPLCTLSPDDKQDQWCQWHRHLAASPPRNPRLGQEPQQACCLLLKNATASPHQHGASICSTTIPPN
jgi:hypothetical protein